MTKAHIKERLSTDFVSILAHSQGFTIKQPELDYGVDLKIGAVTHYLINGEKRYFQSSKIIDVQLKSTTTENVIFTETAVKFDLKTKNFNDLVFRKNGKKQTKGVHIPLILICYIVPASIKNHVKIDESKMTIEGSAFWYYPSESMQFSKNKQSQRIEIPLENRINLDFCSKMFNLFHKNRLL